MASEATVTTTPYFVNPQKLIGSPALAAMPRTTTLAPAATAVAFPPRSAPHTNAHHSGLSAPEWGVAATISSTIGTIAVLYGMLSTKAPNTPDPKSSAVAPSSSRSPIQPAASSPRSPMTPTSTSEPTRTNSAMKNA